MEQKGKKNVRKPTVGRGPLRFLEFPVTVPSTTRDHSSSLFSVHTIFLCL